ncbi:MULTISPECIES: hypothetical protein [Cyanophyceae]|nr:hypothetical protein [Phormidium sp. FACHB-592]
MENFLKSLAISPNESFSALALAGLGATLQALTQSSFSAMSL